MNKYFVLLSACFFLPVAIMAQPGAQHNLQFSGLAKRWDEGMPLGNGMLGVLVWQKQEQLRLTLDRADLWDERKALDLSKFNFTWVEKQVLKKDYKPVQQLGDYPYDQIPYPTKLPAAAIEFNMAALGTVVSNTLDIHTALNTVRFHNGVVFSCYVHATQPVGYFRFENLPSHATPVPQLIIHNYRSQKNNSTDDNSHAGEGLEKLGYAAGTVSKAGNSIRYRQPTYNGRYYEVLVQWKSAGNKFIGAWTVADNRPAVLPALETADKEQAALQSHKGWWKNYWSRSSVRLPDTLIEKQYYLELYKLGCVARAGAPAITLQAVWTADNGSLPPWKGDFHNDLNTQLSYWPAYTGNHLAEGATFTDWLWKIRKNNLQYTRQYFGVDGLNVPGVVTLNGDPMGGWIQYSLSPTIGAWCAQHFYWQWKYLMDKGFLQTRAYPYIHKVATYLEGITRLEGGVRKLPLSSSPEYNNNNLNAWFLEWSNYDLSLAKFLFAAAAEVAEAVNKKSEAVHWQQLFQQLPAYEINDRGFTVAPGQNLNESHRHLSPYMAVYPLALVDVNKPEDKSVIERSLKGIEQNGTRAWCGYSFSWMACLYARAYQSDSALKQLQIFASNFCSPNSFHLNGDQRGGQYSDFTYRPFTLEGNFAFAQGVHELLLQSRSGYVEVFPAVPDSWKNVSFSNLRTEGAFVVSAKKENGIYSGVQIKSEKGGVLKVKLPFEASVKGAEKEGKLLVISFRQGETVKIKNPAIAQNHQPISTNLPNL